MHRTGILMFAGLCIAAYPAFAAEEPIAKLENICVNSTLPTRGNLCNIVAAMYLTGVGAKRDDSKARKFLAIACEEKVKTACYDLGALIYNGRGGPEDKEQGIALIKKSCRLGNKDACKTLNSSR